MTTSSPTPRAAVLAALLAVSAPVGAQPGAADPRIELVELQQKGQTREALERTRELIGRDPTAAALGLHLLEGHLLDALGRHSAAAVAFARGVKQSPDLAAYGRYRLALEHAELDHPELSAGLVATVVSDRPPTPSPAASVRLLRSVLDDGGDCGWVRDLDPDVHASATRRQLTLLQADCALRSGDRERARGLFTELLEETVGDEVARTAADGLAPLAGTDPTDEVARLLGLAYHQHRDFDRAIRYLGPLVAGFQGPLDGDRFDLAYTLVRSRFWQERYAQAANGYAALAARAAQPSLTARALYQQGRCHELTGDWPQAAATFRRTYRADPDGNLAAAALIGALRLEWRGGDEGRALELYELLTSRRRWIGVASRAALFLAASDLVQGRADRAGGWLDAAARAGRAAEPEHDYWRARLAELRGAEPEAVRRYLRVLRHDLYHPLARDAERRLRRPDLAAEARRLADRRASVATPEARYDAWLLAAADPRERARRAGELARQLSALPATAPHITLSPVPVERWPMWRTDLSSPQEKLLALGIVPGAEEALQRHFPLTDPALAMTRGLLLAHAGELRASVLVGEVLARRIPVDLPEPFLPISLRRLLHPFAYPGLVVRESIGRRLDPHLLLAVMREESRFDQEALSPASARGLTQFVHPTAERVAQAIGLHPVEPEDLYRPEIAIALGAAYLAELIGRFGGVEHAAVAAYNAGEPAARLWSSYCYSGEPAEYFTKVSYRQTRNYLAKVLGSRARYDALYRAPQY